MINKIAIIGAGISGLTVANILNNYYDVTIFDKSKGVGGRVATRRAEPYIFDHGAQFFTVRHKEVKEFIKPLIENNIIKPWKAKFVEITKNKITNIQYWNDDYPHYVGVPNMNNIGKYLSKPINIKLNEKISAIKQYDNKWDIINTENQKLGQFEWIIITCPPIQAIEILKELPSLYPNILNKTMKACFSLMLGFKEKIKLEFDAALVKNKDISWISNNNTKPGRNNKFSLLIHSTNNWADQNLDKDENDTIKYLCDESSEIVGYDLNKAEHLSLHCWKYANIKKQHNEEYFIDTDNKIGLCGDWFIQGKIEAAFVSGIKLGNHLIKYNLNA